MMCLLLSRGLSKVALAESIECSKPVRSPGHVVMGEAGTVGRSASRG
jgi:hypothetical protein